MGLGGAGGEHVADLHQYLGDHQILLGHNNMREPPIFSGHHYAGAEGCKQRAYIKGYITSEIICYYHAAP